MVRRGVLQLLSILMYCWSTEGEELVRNGDFDPDQTLHVDGSGSSGTYGGITGIDVAPFPGDKTTALQMLPGSVVTITGESKHHDKVGWYKVQFFVHVHHSYSGETSSAFSVDILDSTSAVVSLHSYRIPLRGARGEWLHYSEWVPCNRVGRTAPRLSIVPGTRFNAGLLQITGLSIQHKDFADRALTPIDLCRCTVPLSGTICGNKAQPSCVPTACQTSGPGHCTPGYSDNSIETAYDGLLGRGDGYTTTIQQASRPIETHTIEVDLGSTIRVCGVQLYWDASGQYAQTWRVLATNGAAYDLWAEAAPEGGGKEVISGPPAWAITPNQAGQVAQNDYGLQCVNARRVRLEMEDSASPLFFKLLELRLLTGEAPCTCRHGGVCLDNGGCSCPTVAHRDCFIPECGWGGPTCSQASCGPRDDPAVRCNNCRGSNCCTGPNTCTCTLGWHGTSGPQQCVTPRCGDGAVTNTVEGGSERCDDGNLVNGDGCSDQCQVEELHPQRLASPSPPATSLYVPLEEIPGGSQCTEDCTEMVNDQGVATALMNRCRNDGMQCLRSASDSSVAGRLELCEVDIGPQCLVVAQQVVHHEPVCTKNGQLLVGVGFDGCPALGGRKEVKYEFKQFSCDVICYNGGRCPSHKNGCICPAGWEGDDCSISQCSRGCDHGGTCINTDDCGDCSRGWTGEFCGTAEGFLATLTVCFAAVVCVVLAFSIVLTCLRMTWVPIRARGMMSLLGKFIGGIIWIMTAVCSIWGEMFAYDARLGPHVAVGARGTCMVEVNEPWKTSWAVTKPHWPQTADDDCADQIYCHRDDELSEDCEGNTNKWQFWYTLVFGFGLWLASNLGYLRSMIQIHISHKLPLAFIALAIFLLAPWMIASWVGSPFLALGLAIAYLLYTCMLYAELWPIRTDFLDVKHHAWGCIAAIVNVMGQIWIVQGGRVGRRIDWDLDWDFKAVVPATLATVNALVTVSIVAVHFCFTAGHLLYLALFKANNPHVLEEYYDEYNPDDKDHFKAQMHTFDHQVRTHARTIDDHSLRGRIARRRFKGDTSVMEEEQQTRVENHCGWKSCLLFPFTAGLVYFCPVDKREVYVRDGSPVNPLCHHKIHRSAKASYHHVAQNTVVGHHVHKHAYHREQFGARKKLKVKTLEGMGRNTDESGWWSAEDGFRNGESTTGVEDSANTPVNKSGGWRAQAAVRAKDTRDDRAVAMPTPHQLPGQLPPLNGVGSGDGHHHHHHHHHHHTDGEGEAVSPHHHRIYGDGP